MFNLGFSPTKSKWSAVSEKQKQFFIKNVTIKTALETLNEIKETINIKEKGAYMRFGDGDVYLMKGLDEMLNQSNKKLSREMKEAFQLKIGKLHKGLPIHSNLFGFEDGMKNGVHLVSDQNALKLLGATYKFIDIKNVYSPTALHYLATYNVDYCLDFLKYLKNQNPIFVGNAQIKEELVQKLFGNIHIKTPAFNSYQEIDRIEKELITELKKHQNEFKLVVVALGCPGRVLQKRILKKGFNVYLFDFGSLLDAFNGEDSRLWIELTGGAKHYQNLLNNLD